MTKMSFSLAGEEYGIKAFSTLFRFTLSSDAPENADMWAWFALWSRHLTTFGLKKVFIGCNLPTSSSSLVTVVQPVLSNSHHGCYAQVCRSDSFESFRRQFSTWKQPMTSFVATLAIKTIF